MDTRTSPDPRAYSGPWPIRSHRTLADVGFGEHVMHTVVIGIDLGSADGDFSIEQVIDGECRVIAQRIRGADGQPAGAA